MVQVAESPGMEREQLGDSSEGRLPVAVRSAAIAGMDAHPVAIEGSSTSGYAAVQFLGAVSEVCKAGVERAKTALEKLGLRMPPERIILSATPADLKLDGNQLDLALAILLWQLLGAEVQSQQRLRYVFVSELGLNGQLRPVRGVVPHILAAIRAGAPGVVMAASNSREAQALSRLCGDLQNFEMLAFDHLSQVLAWLQGHDCPHDAVGLVPSGGQVEPEQTVLGPDFDDMILSPDQRLAAKCVAVGRHSMLLRGTPGTGKSMFAARLPSIWPTLERRTHLDVLRIHSLIKDRLSPDLLAGRAPLRMPHHQSSTVSMMGGLDSPGELALSHGGLIFLDEFPEFRRDSLELLREPLETGELQVARKGGRARWLTRVVLVAACNNCKCGWIDSTRRECACSHRQIVAYQNRISGPILDRIDIHLRLPEPDQQASELFFSLTEQQASRRDQTATLRVEVAEALEFSKARASDAGLSANRDLRAQEMLKASGLAGAAFADLVNTTMKKHASHRSAIRALRVARTLADLEASDVIRATHLRQAMAWQPAAPTTRPDIQSLREGLATHDVANLDS